MTIAVRTQNGGARNWALAVLVGAILIVLALAIIANQSDTDENNTSPVASNVHQMSSGEATLIKDQILATVESARHKTGNAEAIFLKDSLFDRIVDSKTHSVVFAEKDRIEAGNEAN